MSYVKHTNEGAINKTATFAGKGANPEKIFNILKDRIHKTYIEKIEAFTDIRVLVIPDGYDYHIRINKNDKFAKYLFAQGHGEIFEDSFIFKYNDIIQDEFTLPHNVIRHHVALTILYVLAEFGIKAEKLPDSANASRMK